MGYIVIKPHPDRDEYVYWSTIVEAPIAYGSRAEMLDELAEAYRRDSSRLNEPEARLQRADRYGSSALDGCYRWDDPDIIYEQRGYLPRASLFEAARLIDQDREPEVWDLMTPFEDEKEVRRG